MTYYATWNASTIICKWDSQGGSAVGDTSAVYSPTAKIPMPAFAPTRTGYTFAGWWTAAAGSASQVTSGTALPTSNKTFYARWSLNPYTIAYDLDGGSVSGSGNPITYNTETATFTLKNPTRAGYVFAGWSGTGLTGSANKTVAVAKGSTGNRSYTAHWTPLISADVSPAVELRLDILGVEEAQPAVGAIRSLCGEPLKVASVAFSPLQGATDLFGSNRADVAVEGTAQGASRPGFSFSLDVPTSESDPTRLAGFSMAPLSALDVSYKLAIDEGKLEAILAAIDPARFEQQTTPVCSVAYTVALA